jgi:hypothetical protein
VVWAKWEAVFREKAALEIPAHTRLSDPAECPAFHKPCHCPTCWSVLKKS